MPYSSGFTLIELLISLTLAALLSLGSLVALLSARQQVVLAAQYTQASAALADVATVYADTVIPNRDWQVANPPSACVLSLSCPGAAEQQQAVQQHFSRTAVPLLAEPELCIHAQGLQLSWRSQLQLPPQNSLCPLAPKRLSSSLRASS